MSSSDGGLTVTCLVSIIRGLRHPRNCSKDVPDDLLQAGISVLALVHKKCRSSHIWGRRKKQWKKKTNKHKEFWRDTPWCASRLSRGHVPSVPWYVPSVPGTFCPFSIDLHINQAQMSQVSLGRPEFVPGTPPGHPTAKFLYVIFLYRFFLSLSEPRGGSMKRNFPSFS